MFRCFMGDPRKKNLWRSIRPGSLLAMPSFGCESWCENDLTLVDVQMA